MTLILSLKKIYLKTTIPKQLNFLYHKMYIYYFLIYTFQNRDGNVQV